MWVTLQNNLYLEDTIFMGTKDKNRDYATVAFATYIRLGCPTREEREAQIRQEVYDRHRGKDPKFVVGAAEIELRRLKGHLDDIEAVNKTFDMLYGYIPPLYVGAKTHNGKDIADAVKEIYFTFGNEKIPERDIIGPRVRAHAMAVPVDTRTVYRWLKYARNLFALLRGLDVSDIE